MTSDEPDEEGDIRLGTLLSLVTSHLSLVTYHLSLFFTYLHCMSVGIANEKALREAETRIRHLNDS